MIVKPKILFYSSLIFIFLLPCLLVILYQADFINLASESTAYRFFYAIRNQGTPDPSAWLPQGQLVSAIQSLWLFVLQRAFTIDKLHLREAINLFGITSLLSFNCIGVITLIMAFRSNLENANLGLLAIFVFSITYCIKHNYGMLLWPDYYLLNVNLALAGLFLFMQRCKVNAAPSSNEKIGACVFVGLLAANKINMAIIAIPYLLLLFLQCKNSKNKIIFVMQVALTVSVIWLLVFLVVGNFHISWLKQILPSWYNFLMHPGGDDGFGALTYLFSVYEIAGLICISGFICALLSIQAKDKILLFIGLTLGFFVSAVAVFKRPAGTTMFDMALIEMVFGCAYLAMLDTTKLKSRVVMILALVAILDAYFSFPAQAFFHDLKQSQKQANEQWLFFNKTVNFAAGRPVTYFLPDNSHQFGDVFIMALKGASVFPTWSSSELGSTELSKIFRMPIQFQFEGKAANEITKTSVLVWIDKVGAKPLSQRYASLAYVMANHKHSENVVMPLSGTIGHIVEVD